MRIELAKAIVGGAPGGQASTRVRTVLVACSHFRDRRELARLATPNVRLLLHDYASTSLEELIGGRETHEDAADPMGEVERLLQETKGEAIAAVVSTDDYPGSALASVLAKRLGLPGPEPKAVLVCQQKYLSRLAQREIVPEAVPPFAAIDVAAGAPLPEGLSFPVFVKPVKSFFSIGARTIACADDLIAEKVRWAGLDGFFLPLERMLKAHAAGEIGSLRLIAEGLLSGRQVTVEGYVFAGEAGILGIVDSIFHEGTIAFSRFDYPSALPPSVQDRMGEIAARLMVGLGFDNGIFNIEMMYDEARDAISVIEINPRMASQFADLYEKVDGTNAYEVLLDIGLGVKPCPKRREGAHLFASSVVLRTFEDCLARALPSEDDIASLEAEHPGIRVEVHAALGKKLSDELQDGASYRYGVVNLGGTGLEDVLARFERYRARLGIELVPV